MGFYIRKSKRLGPFRLNISKSGLGISVGMKGARLSTGPKGTYFNAGKDGIYYRKKLGGPNSPHSSQSNGRASNINLMKVLVIIVGTLLLLSMFFIALLVFLLGTHR